MPKPYDDAMKRLVAGSPRDFLTWVLPAVQYKELLPHELHIEHVYADGLVRASLNGQELLAHFEFQSSYDPRMSERLLEYNVLASRQYGYLPVYSCVIYLKDCGEVPRPPFIRRLPSGEETVRLNFGVIELHKITAEDLEGTGLVGLAPLLPLTKNGARREVVDRMISSLLDAEQTQSLWVGYALAAKVMKSDLKWLKWRFAMLSDFLRDSPVYQEVLEEGMERGLERGLERGREEELQRQRQAVIDIAQERFPDVADQVKNLSGRIHDPSLLMRLIVKIGIAHGVEEVRELLEALEKIDGNGH